MRAVDPGIELILDGRFGGGMEKAVLAHPGIRERFRYAAFHAFAPGPMGDLSLDGENVEHEDLEAKAWFEAWAAMPGGFDAAGRNVAWGEALDFASGLGYAIAAIEWNWNGWAYPEAAEGLGVPWQHAAAVGVAGSIHGMIRQGGQIRIANQSMPPLSPSD